MGSAARRFSFSPPRIALVLAAVVYVGVCAVLVASGGQFAFVLAALAVVGPVLGILAVRRPYVFPYAAYVVVVPLENVLSLPGFGTLSRGLGIVSGLALIVWIVQQRRINPLGKAAFTWALLIVWELTTVIWAPDVPLGLLHVGRIFEAFALFALLAAAPIAPRDVRVIVGAFVGGGVIAALYGIWLAHAQPGIIVAGRLIIGDNTSYIDPNHFANALVAPTLFAAVGVLALRGPLRIAAASALVPLVWGIEITLSREAFLALGIGLVYLALRSRFRRTFTATLAAAVVVTLATPTLVARFAAAANDGGAGRTDIWSVGWAALQQHFPFGDGAGSFPAAYDAAYIGVFQHMAAGWSRAPHDLFLQIGTEYGILGIVVVFAAWFMTFRETAGIRRDDPRADLARVVEAAIVALLVASTFIDLMEEKYVWLVFALAVQIRHMHAGADVVAGGGAVARPRAKPIAYPT
jgi:hypothetical protein